MISQHSPLSPLSLYALHDFALLPKFVGTWQGDWICLDPQGKRQKKFQATLEQRIVDNRWEQSNHNQYEDGSSDTWRFFGRPIAANVLLLESPDAPYNDFKMTISEVDSDLIILRVWDKTSNQTLAIETIYLAQANLRIRTMHQFDGTGQLRGFMLINERKIAEPC